MLSADPSAGSGSPRALSKSEVNSTPLPEEHRSRAVASHRGGNEPECSSMSNEPIDPRWPRLLSLAVHEFRTPITVVAGYLRMVLKERAGPISDQQRKLLEEAEKSCGRLSALVAEMSDLSGLEAGSAPFNRAPLDLSALVQDVVAAMPVPQEPGVSVILEGFDGQISLSGDGHRLRTAFAFESL